jgi:hypothetical protein
MFFQYIMDRIRQGSYRTEELNERVSNRNIPSGPLQPQFDIRPLSTKYSMMPIFDRRPIPTVSIQVLPTYNISNTFNPGNAQAAAPWSGFATNINDESRLRNQFFALQRGAGQSTYIPSRYSDMYEVNIQTNEQELQPFPSLFEKGQFDQFNPAPKDSGINLFNNFTRYQIKEIA